MTTKTTKPNRTGVFEQDLWGAPGWTLDGLGDDSSDEVRVQGWAARYDQEFTKWQFRDYEFRRVHVKDCFRDSLASGADVYLALNHDFHRAFARTGAGTMVVENRPEGVWFDARVDKRNPDALAMLVELDRGTLSEASIGYAITDEERRMRKVGDLEVETQFIREADIDHGDVSVCLYGSNHDTSAWVLPADSMRRVAALYPDGPLPFDRPSEDVCEVTEEEVVDSPLRADTARLAKARMGLLTYRLRNPIGGR